MARRDRTPGRNRQGGYDLSDAYGASERRSSRGNGSSSRSPYDTGAMRDARTSRKRGSSSASARADRSSSSRADSATVTRNSSNSARRRSSDAQSYSRSSMEASSSRKRSRKQKAEDYSREASADRYKARKSRKAKKIAAVVGIIVLIALIGCGVAVGMWYNNISDKITSDVQAVEPTTGEPYYVLLLGGDSRISKKSDTRADSIMLARVDEENKKVSLVSIPRDLRVPVEGHGYCKINAAITYGGIEQTLKTVGSIFDIEINYYAFIYFSGFAKLVDKLDGVTVEVPEGTYYHGVSVPAGDAVLINGKEALVLARCRHGNPPDQGAYAAGDYQRTLNQRNLIKAIAKKILSRNVSQYPSLLEGLSECVETNMSVKKMVNCARAMKGMDVEDMQTAQLITAADIVNGEWFACLYDDIFQVMRSNFINGDELMKGLDGYELVNLNANMSNYAVDGEKYTYVYYEKHFGSFSKKKG